MPEAPIRGDGFTIQQLFSQFQFRLDPYQREYSWAREDVKMLVDDLTGHFIEDWVPGHDRREVRHYRPYFLGPFVYYRDDDLAALVDGQQRITTLHLLLLQLRRLAIDADRPEYHNDIAALEPLIAGTSYGERAYAIRSEKRTPVLEAIYEDKPYVPAVDAGPSVENLHKRSEELYELLPESIREEALPLFIHWLLNRVCLVGINANNRRQGWEIFETMNDRGVQLGPADLLKSFLLRKASNRDNLPRLGEAWSRVLTRIDSRVPQAAAKFLQSLLIGRYAQSEDEATDISVSFHGWVQEHHSSRMGLINAPDFASFIEHDLVRLATRYATLRAAAVVLEPGLEPVFYNSKNEIDQMPFLMAVIDPDDTDAQFREKARLVAAYLDIVFVRLAVNNRLAKSGGVDNDRLPVLLDLRSSRDIDGLAKALGRRIARLGVDFTGVKGYGLRMDNRAQVRYLLARLTAFVETECGRPNEMPRYLDKEEPFEIEHIWANKFERYQPEVKTEATFRIFRNRFGALLLLKKSHNASYQDSPYEQKVEWYRGQNHLASSLHAVTHQRNKPFTAGVVKKRDLGKLFHHMPKFGRAEIEVRQQLYERLCEIIWDPADLGFILPPGAAPITASTGQAELAIPEQRVPSRVAKRTRAHFGGVTIARLVAVGALSVDEQLYLTYKRVPYTAVINHDGRIQLSSGEVFESPSPAGSTVTGKAAMNGWSAWKVRREGNLIPLFDIRAEALRRGLLEESNEELGSGQEIAN
ncbi:DUF262 domain-containing protein [Micromonospora sp. WMMA1998]|uniref:GmrSD restriction endonuclease domain-containing protein n=1 Tax=Micromonospora sp. WMMA1998 TaxID=3015167 RepID=UPI00248AC1DC|nr:DUF262 domain-containing protein [Micromonospora sp. WMMA1998]WBC17000.1 DUF262 domain-containing protein [Micromonospora sp. WMMA1998]